MFAFLVDKLLVLIGHSKAVLVVAIAGTFTAGVVITGTIGNTPVNLLISPAVAFPGDPVVVIDAPKVGARAAGAVEVTGWAVDRNAEEGTGVDKVTLYLDRVTTEKKLGDATYGSDRPEVAELYDAERFTKSGWTFKWDAGDLEGNHKLFAVARGVKGHTSVASLEVNDPLVRIDTPLAGSKVKGIVEMAGWAIDRTDETGTGITSVSLYLDDAKGTKLADASLGDATPDVADKYGERFDEAGWQYLWDTTAVTPGAHTLFAVALSSQSTHTTTTSVNVTVKKEDDDEDESTAAGCSQWAHERNDAWHTVHGLWKSARADLDSLKVKGKDQEHPKGKDHEKVEGKDKSDKHAAKAAIREARRTIDAALRTAHSAIQTLALEHKCEAGLDYATIVTAAQTAMTTAVTDAQAVPGVVQKKEKHDEEDEADDN